jgi:site-specific DNA-methyltransferase (adenine-specific)
MNKVHLCDNMEFMKGVPDKYYELCICDPPYGINAPIQSPTPTPTQRNRLQRLNGGGGKLKDRVLNTAKKINWDSAIPDPEYFIELMRISKNQVIWGGNYFPLPPTRCVIAWDKMQPWENFSQWEMAWTSFDSPARLFQFDNRTGDKIHPTQKPVALYKWLLKNYAKPNDKIFDSHVGSGSIRIACHDMGFDFEGCEIDKDYWEAQEARYQEHIQQAGLFGGEELQSLIYAEQQLM